MATSSTAQPLPEHVPPARANAASHVEADALPAREVGVPALKALAHPLRVQLFSTLMALGPDTASGLAKRLGESSGATSYHLRQLARHGFVEEVPDRGTGRERWWRVVHGPYSLASPEVVSSPVGLLAVDLVQSEMVALTHQRLSDFQRRFAAGDEPQRWFDAATVSWIHTFATLEELRDLSARLERVAREWREGLGEDRSQNPPVGTRPVELELLAFPVAPVAPVAADDGPDAGAAAEVEVKAEVEAERDERHERNEATS